MAESEAIAIASPSRWARNSAALSDILLLAQPIEVLLRLIAANLVLERIDALLPLQVIDLLPLAQRIALALDPL